MNRIDKVFKENEKVFVGYVMAGDPDYNSSLQILKTISKSVDIIELGVPFSDPVADGEVIEHAAQRALKNNIYLKDVFNIVREFRKDNQHTPIILMGYYNPIYSFGIGNAVNEAKDAGVDGFLTVDLPPEENEEFVALLNKQGLHSINLITPTSDDARIQKITQTAGGFLYFVSVKGITGDKSSNGDAIKPYIDNIRKYSDLPICVGFGIKTPENAKDILKSGCDGIVIGSQLVQIIEEKGDYHNYLSEIKEGLL